MAKVEDAADATIAVVVIVTERDVLIRGKSVGTIDQILASDAAVIPGLKSLVSDDEWEAELNRRVQDMKSGAVIPIPASQVLAELRSEFP